MVTFRDLICDGFLYLQKENNAVKGFDRKKHCMCAGLEKSVVTFISWETKFKQAKFHPQFRCVFTGKISL